MIIDANKCFSFENANAFGQEYSFGEVTETMPLEMILVIPIILS